MTPDEVRHMTRRKDRQRVRELQQAHNGLCDKVEAMSKALLDFGKVLDTLNNQILLLAQSMENMKSPPGVEVSEKEIVEEMERTGNLWSVCEQSLKEKKRAGTE